MDENIHYIFYLNVIENKNEKLLHKIIVKITIIKLEEKRRGGSSKKNIWNVQNYYFENIQNSKQNYFRGT